jgi:hypothetical protein
MMVTSNNQCRNEDSLNARTEAVESTYSVEGRNEPEGKIIDTDNDDD